MATNRGLVLVPRFQWDGRMLSFSHPDPFPMADLRRYTLYWDRLDFPENNVINFKGAEDLSQEDLSGSRALITIGVSASTSAAIEYLKQAGVLQRTYAVVERPKEMGAHAAYVQAQLEAFRHLKAKEPGLWALGQSAVDFFAPRESTSPTRTVEIELFETLPTPPDNVSLSRRCSISEFVASQSLSRSDHYRRALPPDLEIGRHTSCEDRSFGQSCPQHCGLKFGCK